MEVIYLSIKTGLIYVTKPVFADSCNSSNLSASAEQSQRNPRDIGNQKQDNERYDN